MVVQRYEIYFPMECCLSEYCFYYFYVDEVMQTEPNKRPV